MTAVTQSVIEARVRLALAREGEVLHRDEAFDDYITRDAEHHLVTRERCSLGQLARECGVLRPGEVIEE